MILLGSYQPFGDILFFQKWFSAPKINVFSIKHLDQIIKNKVKVQIKFKRN